MLITMTANAKKEPPRKIATAEEQAQAEAREQAEQYEGVFGSTRLDLDNDDFIMIPPHPDYNMLDDERMDAWDELIFRVDTQYEREPDVYHPERTLDNGVTLGAETVRGALKRPFRIVDENGVAQLVKPAHSVNVVQIVLGEEDFKRLKAGGKNAADVWRVWGEQSLRIQQRRLRDSKSVGSAVAVEAVSEADS